MYSQKRTERMIKKNNQRKEKAILKLNKKLKITSKTSQEEINAKYLEYVKTAPYVGDVFLTDVQYNDPDFMLAFYKANTQSLLYKTPTDTLQQNQDFMIEYYKLRYQQEFEREQHFGGTVELSSIINRYQPLLRKTEFIEKLATVFPEYNTLEEVYKAMCSIIIGRHMAEKDYLNLVSNLPTEFLSSQAEKFGGYALAYIPKNHPKFDDFVKAGIECDNFESLVQLDINKVLDNKDLIIKAYENSGDVRRLTKYLTHDLDPNRVHVDTEPYYHEHIIFDEDYEKVQLTLLQDEDLLNIINNATSEDTKKQPTNNEAE